MATEGSGERSGGHFMKGYDSSYLTVRAVVRNKEL